ncbi:MAG: DUF418 domain-containing protein [Sphingobium sp.]|nr:DUF418 domain-containing protein [Sphingobium sp.]
MAVEAPARIAPVDSLRGFALFGLFIVHMIEYFELYWMNAPAEPGTIHEVIFGMFGGKAFALLALCFGFSFHILFERARAKGEDFALRFAWRMILLFMFGVVHGFIYRGDIINVLAVFGLLLIPIDRVKSSTLLIVIAVLCFAQPMLVARVIAADVGSAWGLAAPGFYTDPAMAVYAKGGFLDLLRANLWDGQVNKWSFYVETGRVFQMFGLFLMGVLAGRTGFFAAERLRERKLWLWSLLSVLALVVTYLLRDYLAFTYGDEPGFGTYSRLLVAAWVELSATALWTFLFLWAWTGPVGKLQALFVAPGRLTLTLYLGQSFLFVPFFYGFGAGAYAWIGQGPALALGLVAFVLQMAGAAWWLKRYHYGPLEWLWRAATYRTTAIPFRKVAE